MEIDICRVRIRNLCIWRVRNMVRCIWRGRKMVRCIWRVMIIMWIQRLIYAGLGLLLGVYGRLGIGLGLGVNWD